MSSVFKVLLLFWFVAMSLLSSWDEKDVRVKLTEDYVWAAEDDKTGFLSVGVDSFNRWYLKERPISFPVVPMSTIKRIYENEIMWEKLTKIEVCENFDE